VDLAGFGIGGDLEGCLEIEWKPIDANKGKVFDYYREWEVSSKRSGTLDKDGFRFSESTDFKMDVTAGIDVREVLESFKGIDIHVVVDFKFYFRANITTGKEKHGFSVGTEGEVEGVL
jgi:hypothetical protein